MNGNLYFLVANLERSLQESNKKSELTTFNAIAADQQAIKIKEEEWAKDIDESKTAGVIKHGHSSSFGILGGLECLVTLVALIFCTPIGLPMLGLAITGFADKSFGEKIGLYQGKDPYSEIKNPEENNAVLQKIARDQTAVQELMGNANNKIQIEFNTEQQTNTSDQEIFNSILSDFSKVYNMRQGA